MKKTLSLILTMLLVIAVMTSLVIHTAAEEEGAFKVVLSEDSERLAEEQRPPIPGYYYDDDGFHTSSNGYKNFNPKFTVVSKEMYNIKNFSMTVVIHDYSVVGDNWFSFTLWSESNGFAMGDTSGKYGDGWTSIIRAREDGILNRLESWNQTKGLRSGVQVFSNIDNTQTNPLKFEPNVDEATGDIIMTFTIVNGVVSINGLPLGENTDKTISTRFKEGLAYVGVTLHNTDASGNHNPTVSIIEVNGEIPSGSDSRAPQEKVRELGEMRDPSTVANGMPAIWFDGTLQQTNNTLPADTRYCAVSFSEDNMNYKVTAENYIFYMQFDVPDAITYNASDFMYFAAIFKNYCTCNLEADQTPVEYCTNTSESLHIRYCAGNITSPNDDCIQKVESFYNVSPFDSTDLYTVAILAIDHDEWQGRINAIRLDFGNFESCMGIEGRNTFEIMFAGVFKSGADIASFVNGFRKMNLDSTLIELDYAVEICYHIDMNEDGYCDDCGDYMNNNPSDGDPIEPNDTAESETTGEITEDTTKTSEATANTTDATTEETKSGCGATVSVSVLGLVALAGASMTCFKKKEN